jgi:carboxyl-terminal processing protease
MPSTLPRPDSFDSPMRCAPLDGNLAIVCSSAIIRRNTAWVIACICVTALAAHAHADTNSRYVALGDEIVRNVREQFLDVERGRVWAEKHAGYGATAKDASDFERLTAAALAELASSHTAYYAKDSIENVQLRSLFGRVIKGPSPELESLGADFAELPNGTFVRHVFAGGPAANAGLLRGDRIVSADGKPFDPVRSLRGKHARPVSLEVERVKGAALVKLIVVPRKTRPAEEWLAAQDKASTVVERSGRRIAYTYLYSCAGPEPVGLLERTMKERFTQAEALVIDIRDGWGGCPPELLDLFNPFVPTLRFIGRDGTERLWPGRWDRPVVLLINGNTRSGKEMVAFAFQKHDIGPVVGERTAGAFLAGKPIPLSDGSLLYLATETVEVDGTMLERKGVPPDVEVASGLLYAAGSDPQRERALDIAAELAAKRTRRVD